MKKIPYDITFHPSWWHRHAGVDFDEPFFFDPDVRTEADIRMRRTLWEYFGDYGIVGFGQYCKQQDKLILREFAMSCRVAGKFVESALFSSLLEREECLQGEMCLIKTKKNVLLRNTLGQIGFSVETESEEKLSLRFTKELLHRNLVKVVYRV